MPKNSFISFSKIHPEDNKAVKHHYFKVKQIYIIQTLTIYGAAGIVFYCNLFIITTMGKKLSLI